MSEPIEKVAERVLAVHNAPRRLNRPYMEQIYESEGRSELYRESAPALAREVLALRKLCRALAEDLSALVPGHLESDVAALAAYRQHFPAPDVKPEGPKG